MGISCWFWQCDWQHIEGHLYQCSRCKTVSIGSWRSRQFGRSVDPVPVSKGVMTHVDASADVDKQHMAAVPRMASVEPRSGMRTEQGPGYA